jgi:hypothetical protein
MKLLLFLVALGFPLSILAQSKLIISVSELRDFKVEGLLANAWEGQEVVFFEKKGRGLFKCKSLEGKSYYKEYNGTWWDLKSRKDTSVKYKRSFTRLRFDSMLTLVFKKDTVKKQRTWLHTSHHYLNILVRIIDENGDTIKLRKTKPFDSTTCWWVSDKKHGFTLLRNLEFDLFIHSLLPEGFIARERLLALPRKKERWER